MYDLKEVVEHAIYKWLTDRHVAKRSVPLIEITRVRIDGGNLDVFLSVRVKLPLLRKKTVED